jgi:hypothetical protein
VYADSAGDTPHERNATQRTMFYCSDRSVSAGNAVGAADEPIGVVFPLNWLRKQPCDSWAMTALFHAIPDS